MRFPQHPQLQLFLKLLPAFLIWPLLLPATATLPMATPIRTMEVVLVRTEQQVERTGHPPEVTGVLLGLLATAQVVESEALTAVEVAEVTEAEADMEEEAETLTPLSPSLDPTKAWIKPTL